MRVGFGLKAHSGWSVLVAIGHDGDKFQVIDRCRLVLVEPKDADWAKQPYHAAAEMALADAKHVIARGIEGALRASVNQLQSAVVHMRERGHRVVACAVLTPAPMPHWSVEEILSVHIRLHKAEGVMFPDALVRGAALCDLNPLAIPEKDLATRAEEVLGTSSRLLMENIAALGKSVGAPWGADQKNASLAAMIALKQRST